MISDLEQYGVVGVEQMVDVGIVEAGGVAQSGLVVSRLASLCRLTRRM